jgi:predicted DNA-binding protein with PD1-like motif
MSVFLVSVPAGQEVIETLSKELRARGITSGAIVSLIGAVDSACISNMPRGDALSDILTEYQQPMEMSGAGEIVHGRPHIHAVLGIQGDAALTGHLHWARVQNHFVNAYIQPL